MATAWRTISGEIFNLRTSARGKCTGVPARACLAAAAKSLVGFWLFSFRVRSRRWPWRCHPF